VQAGCLTNFNTATFYCPSGSATQCYELRLIPARGDEMREYCTTVWYSSPEQQLQLESYFGPTLLSNGWTSYW
jgi:hypothetical protein